MNNGNAGFMLLYFCVYLALFAVITSLTSLLLQRGYYMFKKQGAISTQIEDIMLAHDVWMYDMRLAPSRLSAWESLAYNHVQWKNNEGGAVSWSIRNNMIMRSTTQKKKEVVVHIAHHVKDAQFNIQKESESIQSITLQTCIEIANTTKEIKSLCGFYE